MKLRHNNIQHNYTQYKAIHSKESQQNDIQHKDAGRTINTIKY